GLEGASNEHKLNNRAYAHKRHGPVFAGGQKSSGRKRKEAPHITGPRDFPAKLHKLWTRTVLPPLTGRRLGVSICSEKEHMLRRKLLRRNLAYSPGTSPRDSWRDA